MQKIFQNKNIFSLGIFFAFMLITLKVDAAVLLPGNISTCGELAAPGTYTITQNISGGTNTCFTISSDNVTINGGGFTISGTGDVAIDARVRTGGPSGSLTEGAHAYTNLILNDLNISGYTTGLNISGNSDTTGNGQNNGFGGDAGDVAIFYSYIGSITANGGNTTTSTYGGVGGNISFTDTNLSIASSTISVLGGSGTSGEGSRGGLDLNYSGTLTKTNLVLSALSYFNNNATEYGIYPGGTWPMFVGNISTCGTLYSTSTATFTLTQNVNKNGTCFIIAGDNITLNGAGYIISANDASTTAYAIDSTGYSNFTLASTTVSEFSNLIKSDSSVIVSGTDVDISNKYIQANSLEIISTGLFKYKGFSFSDLTSLIVNGYNYGALSSGLAPIDLGSIWLQRTNAGSRAWRSVTSSNDGTKLAAVVSGGYIYVSNDSGATWTEKTSVGSKSWISITSSNDGTKLAAVVSGGYIYTSTNSGETWVERTNSGSRNWLAIASSDDGSKLVAGVLGGYVYTSTDSGLTWVEHVEVTPAYWYGISSSDDGTKLVAAAWNGYIYTSSDGGETWVRKTSLGIKNWRAVSSSSDGGQIVAVVNNGYIYTSTDGGETWDEHTNSGVHGWLAVASSDDGKKMAAIINGGYVYTSATPFPNLDIAILNPVTSNIGNWIPGVSWDISDDCYYSFDNWNSTSTADCSLNGSDISNPGLGEHTLYIRGYTDTGLTDETSRTFTVGLPIEVSSPVQNQTITSWNPVIDWDPNASGNITLCEYSFDNWNSTSTADCSLNGSDVFAPSVNGTTTLDLKVTNSNNDEGFSEVQFIYSSNPWVARETDRTWNDVAISKDGTKMAAVHYNGYLYTSSDAGITWTQQTGAGSRTWNDVAISDDGKTITGVVFNGAIYNSTTSGATWTTISAAGNRQWNYIAMSASGQYQAISVNNHKIWVSSNYGATWTEKGNIRGWKKIDMSTNGQYIASVSWNGYMAYSSDYGATWVERPEYFAAGYGIAISDDGQEVAVTRQYGGQLYYSYNAGVTWTARSSLGSGFSIDMSADGTKLLFATGGDIGSGNLRISTDDGVSWTDYGPSAKWYGAEMSSNGSKMIAAIYGGKIYTFGSSATDISIVRPLAGSSVLKRAWDALVDWGNSVTCSYSYNNFASSTSVNCSNAGSDIPAPTVDGTYTLSIRGVDLFSNQSNQTVSFDYEPWTIRLASSNQNWLDVDASSDGKNLIAAGRYSSVYKSTNKGVTWTALSAAGSSDWRGVASSADGQTLAVAAATSGNIKTSSDGGVTWTTRTSAGTRDWTDIAVSDSGQYMVAVAFANYVYTSNDYGVTWTARTAAGGRQWFGAAISANGSRMFATTGNSSSQVFVSYDYGATWAAISNSSSIPRNSIAVSADGTKLITGSGATGQIQLATYSGSSWTWSSVGPTKTWFGFEISDDGTRLVATAINDNVYVSNDSGATWTAKGPIKAWRRVKFLDQSIGSFVTLVEGGYIYTSASTPGVTTPASGSTITTGWAPVVDWDRSYTCEYSYNGTDWTSASCSSSGTDINEPPTSGPQNLYIRGTDFQGLVATSSISFSYFAELGTTIDSCGTITTPGAYTLTQDITNVSGTCFIIQTSGVTLNGNGHTISAAGGNTNYAITAGNYQNLVLNNIVFTGFGSGLVSSNSNVTYSGTDIDISNSTSTINSLTINYTSTLTAIATWFSDLTSLVINNIDLLSFVAGQFSWSQNTVSACGTITEPGIYTLTQDITNVSGTCFTLETGLVVFDGNGHTISAAGGNTNYAFVAVNSGEKAYSNIAVINLTLTGFGGGVDAHGEDDLSYTSGTEQNNGGNISLYNVNFPTNIPAVNTSGGNGVYDESNSYGGDAGDIKIVDSIVGTIIADGGDSLGNLNVGYDNGTRQGGDAGTITNSNSTIGTISATAGLGYIPGCTDSFYDNYNENATYDDGSCLSLQVGIERDNFEGDTVSGPLDFYYYSNRGIVNGDANYYSYDFGYTMAATTTAGNIGTTTGYAYFYDEWNTCGTFGNYGYVEGGASLNSCSFNYGTIAGGAAFNSSYNFGTTTGTTTFEWGENGGTINGFADFAYNESASYNYGTVNGDARFYSQTNVNSYNYGVVTGNITYLYGCTDPAAANYAGAIYDEGNCVYYGQNIDLPEGVTYVGDLTFSNGTHNYGTVDGNAIFEAASFNYGTVTGDATFMSYSSNLGVYEVDGMNTYEGTGIVNGTVYDASSVPITVFNFSNGTSNQKVLYSNAIFWDNSYSSELGEIHGNVTFEDFSYCYGQIYGDTIFNTNYYSLTGPTLGVFRIDSHDWDCTVNGNVYGGDNQIIDTYIFNNSTLNLGTVSADAYFNGASKNEGVVTGDAIFNTTGYGGGLSNSSTLTILNNQWKGTIGGNIYASNGTTEITQFDFTGTASNETTVNGNASFANTSTNNGIVSGDAIFTGTTFRIGTVNGTATLTGAAQIIQGINNVVNFIKQLTSGRDTLYLQAGSTLNVSSLFKIIGYNENNLLTVRSTVPNSYANIGINGTADINNVRLRDIRNTGINVDLTAKNVFDDGHNLGFTFKSNTTPGSRGGVTSSYTPPALPPSRGGASSGGAGGNSGGNANSSGLLRNIIRGRINPLNLNPIQNFTPLNPNFNPTNIGATVIPNPFQNLQAPGLINLVQLPTKFLNNISKFLFAPIPNTITDALSNSPRLQTYMASVGVSKEQDLATLQANPVPLTTPSTQQTPPGLFIVKSGEQIIPSFATYDKSAGGLSQLIKVSPNQSLVVSLIPQSTGAVTAQYLGQQISFSGNNPFATTYIQTPGQAGRYILKTSSSPIPLLVEVIEPVKKEEIKKENIFIKIWKWLIK